MKKFFAKIKDWFVRHKPTKRRLIQLYTALLYNANIKGFFSKTGGIYTGNSKALCLPGMNCYSCPGAIGACPLGSLQNALSNSNTTAGAYVFGILILFGLILGRTICGFLCPVGLGQELLYKIKTPKAKKSKVTRILSYLKYVILFVLVIGIPLVYSGALTAVPAFCKYICPAGTAEGAIGLLLNPANAETYGDLGYLFTWKFSVLIAIVVACIFVYRAFCRFLCPLGAFYGFFAKLALLGIKLDKNKCTDCGLCISVCKMDVKKVGDHECINCGECISVCPTKAITWKGQSIFVKESQVDAPVPEVKPLTAFLQKPTEEELEIAASKVEEKAIEVEPIEQIVEEKPEKQPLTPKEKERRRNKWLQIGAWSAAIAVLTGAIVYFNFIDVPDPSDETFGVGDTAFDFTLATYEKEGGYYTAADELDVSLNDCIGNGKVTIVNFWATWCGGCVEELPEFNEFYENYSSSVNMLVVHSTTITHDVVGWLNNYARDYSFTVVQDSIQASGEAVYQMMDGNGNLPMTVIIDEDGTVISKVQATMSYEQLEQVVLPLIS